MRRVEIIQAAQNVAEALLSSRVMGALARMDTTELVCAHADWVARRQVFGEPEERVVAVLGLTQLDDPQFWAKTLSDGANEDPQLLGPISEMHRHARFAQDELPKLMGSLLVRETDAEGADGAAPGQLTVLVIEDEESSTPARLALALTSVDTLYRACARVHSKPDSQVSVVGCDSGGDKSFDFLGDAEVMGTVKDVLLSYWDRIVFYRDDRTDARLGLIAESLPILEDVEQLKASGALDSGTADGIKKQVVDSVTMFAQAGATIPEIQNVAQYDPRKLMRPKAEMLVGSKDAVPAAKAAAKPAEPAAAPAAKPAAAAPAAEKSAATAPAAATAAPAPAAKPAEAVAAEPDAAPLNGEELRRIVAAKVDKVLHGGEAKQEAAPAAEKPAAAVEAAKE
jgi:pyruvate/2-oxoglutarate dehydrogenase complex dihydrolipoamide acyltransferase (E2) component